MDDNARYIVAISEAGSISEAARRLNISQPALSQRLKHLEARLGIELFDRQATRLTPTYAGQIYLHWARSAVKSEEAMERKIAAVANRGRRRLQVGTSLPRGSGMLVDVTRQFYSEVSGCTIFYTEAGMPQSHNDQLNANEIDCAVLTPVRADSPLFVRQVLCRERMLVVAPVGLDLGARDTGGPYPLIDAQAVEGVPFIMPPHNLKHNWMVRSLMDAAGVRLNVVLHSCNNEMTVSLVEQGTGVSILPNTFTYGWGARSVSYYQIDGYPCFGHLYYNRRVDVEPTEDETRFVAMLRAWIERHPELAPEGDGPA